MLSFYIKFWADTDRRTNITTDRWTQVKQYTPNLSMLGHDKNGAITYCYKQQFIFPLCYVPACRQNSFPVRISFVYLSCLLRSVTQDRMVSCNSR